MKVEMTEQLYYYLLEKLKLLKPQYCEPIKNSLFIDEHYDGPMSGCFFAKEDLSKANSAKVPAYVVDIDFSEKDRQDMMNRYKVLEKLADESNDKKAFDESYDYMDLYVFLKTYDAEEINDTQIMDIDHEGIRYKNNQGEEKFLIFKSCMEKFKAKYEGGSDTCVGERNIWELAFYFYSTPLSLHVYFEKKSKITEFFNKNNAVKRFENLQKRLIALGYTTYDVS